MGGSSGRESWIPIDATEALAGLIKSVIARETDALGAAV